VFCVVPAQVQPFGKLNISKPALPANLKQLTNVSSDDFHSLTECAMRIQVRRILCTFPARAQRLLGDPDRIVGAGGLLAARRGSGRTCGSCSLSHLAIDHG
jgi:hypothetical protein